MPQLMLLYLLPKANATSIHDRTESTTTKLIIATMENYCITRFSLGEYQYHDRPSAIKITIVYTAIRI